MVIGTAMGLPSASTIASSRTEVEPIWDGPRLDGVVRPPAMGSNLPVS